MFDAGRRPMGRLFYWVLAVVIISGSGLTVYGAAPVPQNGPASTTVADTVYLADGTTAQGSLIITWPAFVTASGTAVAGGMTNVTLGTNGGLSVALVPNAGATPAGVYYTVVYQLGPGAVKTEYWVVPTTSPANLAEVRTTPGSGVAAQPVSMQYVNSELATKANDSAVVHLSGVETISGTKTFASAPSVPEPTSTGQVANKGYVDQSVSNVGAGNYLPTVGGTMTGPITLPGNPADDRGMYTMEFANDLAEPLALQDQSSATTVPLQDMPVRLSTTQVGSYYLADLTDAQITQVTSTTVQVDAGTTPGSGYGIEVRAHDYGWGAANDRNLLGRFSTQTFSLPRLARTQNYFLRLYDNSSPPRYSRYAGALHVDYPL